MFVLVTGALVVGIQLMDAFPHETVIEYRLGPRHRSVESATIRYLMDGEESKGVSYAWQDGAPRSIRHTVELYPGRYQIRVHLRESSGDRTLERTLEVPAEGTVRIDLFAAAYASLGAL